MSRVAAQTPVVCVSSGLSLREPMRARLEEVAQLLRGRGLELTVACEQAGPYVLYACIYGGQPSAGDAWGPIVRCHVAAALADVVVGPLAQRWLTRRLLREARCRHVQLPPAARPRAVNLARQLVEGPGSDRSGPSGETSPAAPGPADRPGPGPGPSPRPDGGVELAALLAASGARAGLTAHLARWQARIGRCLLEHLTTGVLCVEGLVRFRLQEFVRALDRAARAAVAQLAAEREEQRAYAPWRGLWMGSPPRLYEVHVVRDEQGHYRLLDRWGDSPGGRWGEPSAAAMAELLVGQLLRLAPRRIVLHLHTEDPAQAAVRDAFPGRVHTCRGCPRCLRARQGTPRQPG